MIRQLSILLMTTLLLLSISLPATASPWALPETNPLSLLSSYLFSSASSPAEAEADFEFFQSEEIEFLFDEVKDGEQWQDGNFTNHTSENCSFRSSCHRCTEDLSCVWCESSLSCVDGRFYGPSVVECVSWNWGQCSGFDGESMFIAIIVGLCATLIFTVGIASLLLCKCCTRSSEAESLYADAAVEEDEVDPWWDSSSDDEAIRDDIDDITRLGRRLQDSEELEEGERMTNRRSKNMSSSSSFASLAMWGHQSSSSKWSRQDAI